MRLLINICLFSLLWLSGCSGWTVQPIPNYSPPPVLPSQTPSVFTATPVFVFPTITATPVGSSPTPAQASSTITPVINPTSSETPSIPTTTPTLVTFPADVLKVDILGCNTSLDITHGMGEVTNAFITISNLGTVDLGNLCATLRGQDEGRPHPDKTKCIPSLPADDQVTLKLTIDTTYKEESPIQVDITSNDVLLQRLGKDACSNIGLFPSDVDDLGRIKRIP
jgi:hypothetical protein